MRTPKFLSERTYRGYAVMHYEQMVFQGATPRNPDGWKTIRYWWIPLLDEDERTWPAAKERIDRVGVIPVHQRSDRPT